MVFKWGRFALAFAVINAPLAMADNVESSQENAKGFVEGSAFKVQLRNYYFNQNRDQELADKKDWAQGVLANFSSGYTQGIVGVGVDAFGYFSVKLDGQDKYAGSGNVSVDSDGHSHNSMGKAGAALKLRASKTELKIGDMQPQNPVFAITGSRLLPQTASGISLMSNEWDGLSLEGGHFYSGTSEDDMSHGGDIGTTYSPIKTRFADFAGIKYAFSDTLTTALYTARLKDIWDQYYANLNYVWTISERQSVTFDANLYRTVDSGSAKAGKIDNTSFSGAVSYAFVPGHTITMAYQKIDGDTPFDYVSIGDNGKGGDSVFLNNSSQWADFNGPGERSWQLRYDLNMVVYGLPGFTLSARYVNGDGIDGTHVSTDSAYFGLYGADGRHRETDVQLKYVVQSGPLDELSIRLSQAWARGNADQGDGRVDETRIVIEYPISIF